MNLFEKIRIFRKGDPQGRRPSMKSEALSGRAEREKIPNSRSVATGWPQAKNFYIVSLRSATVA